ncbi:hypothetical protein HID58_018514, partial [Brassica napus]
NQQQRGGGDDVKTLWIGDLLHWMDETYLHTCFSHTNQVVFLLSFMQSAEEAIGSLNGTVIGKNTVRLSWGRSPNKQWRSDSGNQWNGGYSRGQGYNNGYANQDSNMYATAAAAVPGAS